jgi:hypothetical protein
VKPFALRAVELHGPRMHERDKVGRVLAFMQANGLNALVLHESDLVHQLVYPRKYFDPYALWKDLPTRRGENAIFNNRAWFARLLRQARAAGVEVWLNVKEIGFSDEVLAVHPEVVKGGVFCPCEPFWREYIEAKTSELFDDFPQLAGLIVSFGSQESRASKVQNRCKCELCMRTPLQQWYAELIDTLHAPIAARGKQLAVRDFAYKPADHEPLVAAMAAAPQDVVFCIKAMPHDFYVTFPDNPALGRLPRRQFVEYDVLGQFFGWGLMPCLVLDDLRDRVPRWQAAGADGVILRIEWERIFDLDVLDTLNEVNLLAAAGLVNAQPIDAAETCRRWLQAHGFAEQDAPWLAGVLQQTLSIVRGAMYMNGAVSADNSMLPRSVQRAWWGMEVRDSLAVWDPARAGDLQLDEAKGDALVREKDGALAAARRLVAAIQQAEGVDEKLHAYVQARFRFYADWVEGLVLCAKVCIAVRLMEQGQAATAAARLRPVLDGLRAYASRMRELLDADAGIPHQVFMLVDPRRAEDVLRDGEAAMERRG